jgi:hypothetical protein
MTYLLTLYTHLTPLYPQLFEFEAGSNSEAETYRDAMLQQRRQTIRNFALRCKEDTRQMWR